MTDARFADVVRDAPLHYVSDYLSFVGSDARGRVCFALDNNRGFDADPPKVRGRPAAHLQAEHAYAVLHDEHTGWAPLSGVTRYPHPGPDATVLPDSAWFTFTGDADSGLTVRSIPNDVVLDVMPLADRLVGRDTSTLFAMRSAAATLTWRGRTLVGRVIYEGLATTAMNLLSRRSFTGLSGLEFLYLRAGDGPQAGDLYLQKTLGAHAGQPVGQSDPRGVATGLHGVARRTAHGIRRVAVGETHALRREAIKVGRFVKRLRIVRAHVSPAVIVGQQDDDVHGLGCRCGLRRERSKTGESEIFEEVVLHGAGVRDGT